MIHLPAMARAAGVILDLEDFAQISAAVPLMAKVYPNGLADVNHFHAAGGLAYMIGELLEAGLLHPDTVTVAGDGLHLYTREPQVREGRLHYADGPKATLNDRILRPARDPFQSTGGLQRLSGNLGTRGDQKLGRPGRPAGDRGARPRIPQPRGAESGDQGRRYHFGHRGGGALSGPQSQWHARVAQLDAASGELAGQGPARGAVTDGRMSGASGKVPAAIHVSPEAPRAGRSPGCGMGM